jgi:predicted nucleic acid-binding Zn ribbon protein
MYKGQPVIKHLLSIISIFNRLKMYNYFIIKYFMEIKKNCPVCGDPIIGRMDKKFCSDHCRNAFNNQRYCHSSEIIRNVNKILRNNHRILHTLNTHGKAKARREKLLSRGFNFNYFTNTYRTQKGTIYYFCYEQGYLPLGDGSLALVERKE